MKVEKQNDHWSAHGPGITRPIAAEGETCGEAMVKYYVACVEQSDCLEEVPVRRQLCLECKCAGYHNPNCPEA